MSDASLRLPIASDPSVAAAVPVPARSPVSATAGEASLRVRIVQELGGGTKNRLPVSGRREVEDAVVVARRACRRTCSCSICSITSGL